MATKKSNNELQFEEYVAVAVGLTFIAVAFFIGTDTTETPVTLDDPQTQTAAAVDVLSTFIDGADEPSLIIQDIVEGEGRAAASGDTVYVHYVAVLENGDEFENTTDVTVPQMLTLGADDVVAGLEMGIVGMTEDSVRRIIVPAELAYGDEGLIDPDSGQAIVPARETLTYDVTLLAIE